MVVPPTKVPRGGNPQILKSSGPHEIPYSISCITIPQYWINHVIKLRRPWQICFGWWLTYPSEKHDSQLGLLFPIYGKIKNVPNHQPVLMILHEVVHERTAMDHLVGCMKKHQKLFGRVCTWLMYPPNSYGK